MAKIGPDKTTDIAGEPGSSLLRARTAAGLHVEDVARKLHLSPRQVVALEGNNFEHLPGATYVKGYLRNYARLLDLQPEPLLAAYSKHIVPRKSSEIAPSLSQPQQISSSDSVIKFTTLAVAVIIVGLTIVWWQAGYEADHPGGDQISMTQDQSPDTAQFDDLQQQSDGEELMGEALLFDPFVTTQMPESESGDDQQQPSQEIPATSSSPEPHSEDVARPPVGTTSPVVSAEETRTASPALSMTRTRDIRVPSSDIVGTRARSRLILYVDQDSWADIRDAKQNKLLYETVAAGRTINIEGVAPFSVFLGNADGVRVFFNDEEYDVSKHKRGLVARFTLSPSDTPVGN